MGPISQFSFLAVRGLRKNGRVCVCVCACERERDKQTDTERKRKGWGEGKVAVLKATRNRNTNLVDDFIILSPPPTKIFLRVY